MIQQKLTKHLKKFIVSFKISIINQRELNGGVAQLVRARDS